MKTIRNWRRACDERGVHSRIRSKYNYECLGIENSMTSASWKSLGMLNLLTILLCVTKHSLFTQCRKATVLGFTREIVIVGIIVGIESVEWKRREYAVLKNPRLSRTDDVECMFSIMRDLTGKYFTLREARTTWRKCCIQFSKRSDPDLGFYYFSSSYDRFYEGDRPNFDNKLTRSKNQIYVYVEENSHLC